MLTISNCVSQSTQKSPYEMVFSRPVHNNDEFWLELHKQLSNNFIINEEDLPESMPEILYFNDEEVYLTLVNYIYYVIF